MTLVVLPITEVTDFSGQVSFYIMEYKPTLMWTIVRGFDITNISVQ